MRMDIENKVEIEEENPGKYGAPASVEDSVECVDDFPPEGGVMSNVNRKFFIDMQVRGAVNEKGLAKTIQSIRDSLSDIEEHVNQGVPLNRGTDRVYSDDKTCVGAIAIRDR